MVRTSRRVASVSLLASAGFAVRAASAQAADISSRELPPPRAGAGAVLHLERLHAASTPAAASTIRSG